MALGHQWYVLPSHGWFSWVILCVSLRAMHEIPERNGKQKSSDFFSASTWFLMRPCDKIFPPPKRIKQNLFNTVSFETFQQSNPWFRYCMTPWIYKPYIFKKYTYTFMHTFFKYNFKFQIYTFTFFFTYLPPGLKMPCMMLLKGLPFLTRKFHPETDIHLVAICWVDLTGVPQAVHITSMPLELGRNNTKISTKFL